MNALAEMPPMLRPRTTAGGALHPAPVRFGYTAGLLAALAIHAAILFLLPQRSVPTEQVEFGVEAADASVEVDLVAALPAEEPAAVVETPPETPEPMPEPEPEPVVEPPPPVAAAPPEMTLPEPVPPPPTPKKARPEPKPVQKPKPVTRAVRPVGDGSSAVPGNDATTAVASSGAASTKASYLRNPHPAYPEAARAARQEGLVVLRVAVDPQGRPTSVRITKSSGFPLLDERARGTIADRWTFRPAKAGGTPVASEVTIPVRFDLQH